MNDFTSDELLIWSGVLAVEDQQGSNNLTIRLYPLAFQPVPEDKPVWVAHLSASRWDGVKPTILAGEEVEIEVGIHHLVISEVFGDTECSVSFEKIDLALHPYQMADWELQVDSLMNTVVRRENELRKMKRERDELTRFLQEEARRSEIRASASNEHQLKEQRVQGLIRRLQYIMKSSES